jgi:hypothetical protein
MPHTQWQHMRTGIGSTPEMPAYGLDGWRIVGVIPAMGKEPAQFVWERELQRPVTDLRPGDEILARMVVVNPGDPGTPSLFARFAVDPERRSPLERELRIFSLDRENVEARGQ